MSWWDAISDFASSAWEVAKKNPATTIGAIGGLTAGKGIGDAVKWGTAGAVVDAAVSPNSYASQFLGTQGNTAIWDRGPGVQPPSYQTPSMGQPASSTTGTMSAMPGLSRPAYQASATPAPMQAATGGDFGGYNPGVDAYFPGGAGGGATQPNILQQASTGLKKVESWGKENPGLAQAGIQLASAFMGNQNAKRAQNMQREAIAADAAARAKNNQLADAANTSAQRLDDQSWSSYNPQAMGVRSMASALGAGARDLDRIERAGMATGRAPSTVAAEKRRSQLGASLSGVTAYNSGFDTGAKMQQGALTTANALRTPYGTSSYNAQLASDVKGSDNSANITAMLENYLGQPSAANRRKRVEEQGEMRA